MEDIKTFLSGLHTNFDEQNQPKNTYRDAHNWIRLEDGSLTNEQGVVLINYPLGYEVKGSAVIGEDIVLFSKSAVDTKIGIVNKDNVYTSLGNISDIQDTSRIKAEVRVDYRGHRIVYYIDVINRNPVRVVDIDGTFPISDVDDVTKLFLDSDLPIVNAITVGEDGNLPTGVYQFAARLLTATTNATTVSLLTNIVPIVDEFRSVGTESYDGALPQTAANKSITVQATNVDTKYSFIQFIVLTYNSLTNTPKANIIGTQPITDSTITFQYNSLNQNGEELLLDELTVEPITYDSPKAITQKDSHLILGNLKSAVFDPAFQSVANNIVIKYKIKELDFTENISNVSIGQTNGDGVVTFNPVSTQYNNYKGELNTTDFTGYMRGEVYSFAIVPIFKNLSFGYAYHIPAPDISTTPANTTTKVLGTFSCASTVYPSGLGYPVSFVRYHVMPTMKQEPIFVSNKIRVCGIEVSNIDLSGLENAQDIIGYCITRELRTDENKTILAQGIAQPLVQNPIKVGSNPSIPVRLTPFAGKFATSGKQAAFYSPETTIYSTTNLSAATTIEPVASLESNSDANPFSQAFLVRDQRAGTFDTQYAHMFMNYGICDPYSFFDSGHNPQSIKAGSIGFVPAEAGTITVGTGTFQVEGSGCNGYIHLETNSNLNIYTNVGTSDLGGGGTPELNYVYNSSGTSTVRFFGADQNTANFRGSIKRSLFNINANRPESYGGVLDKEYILIGYKLLDDSMTSSLECYGGDTFINKNSIVSTTNYDTSNLVDTTYIQIRCVNYFWCESTINTAYRHHIEGSTVPYFPKDRNISLSTASGANGILQYLPAYGHSNGYNKQYSFQNIVKKFFSKTTIPIVPVDEYTNRIIYSEQAIEGEQFDSYRLFLTDNYHDIPKNKGEITNLFTYRSTLYAHTEQSLWKTSFNESVTQLSSAGEVVLGNGGIFNRPAIEIFPVTGGYAGSINPLATYNSPFGVYFVDGLQSKMFLLGESFEELDYGLRFFIQDALKYVTYNNISDNIANIISTYDYKYDRWIITISNTTPTTPITVTLSFSSKLKSWSSFHDYIPTHMVSVNQKTLICKGEEVGVLNEGERGKYFNGTIYPSTLNIVPNDNPIYAKTYDDLRIDSNIAFTQLEVSDLEKSTSKDLIVNDSWEFEPTSSQQRITNKNSEWRVHFPLIGDDDSRIKGKWCNVELTYDNLVDSKFIVKYIKVTYRINAR